MSQSEQDKDAIIAAQQKLNIEQQKLIVILEQKVDYLIRQLYGKKSEQLDPSQLELLLNPDEAKKPAAAECDQDVPAADQEQSKSAPKKRTRNSRLRKSMESLPCVEEVIDPLEVQENPEAFRRIGEEVSERLEVITARYFRKRTVRPTYVKKNDPDTAPVTAALPVPLLEGSVLSPTLAADILTKKFCYHMPFARQQWEFNVAHGLDISRTMMCHWHDKLAHLVEPLYKLIAADLRGSDYLQVDETPIKYLAPGTGKTAIGYLWVYNNPSIGVLYDWHSSRAHTCLDKILIDPQTGEHFKGVLQSDGFPGYPAWGGDKKGIVLAGCLTHIRRKFTDAQDDHPRLTGWVLNQIRLIYQIEGQLRDQRAGPALRAAIRQAQTAHILERLHKAIMKLKARSSILPKSQLGRALNYALGQWARTKAWVEHGEIEVDNNRVENAVRPTKLGAKNWMFIGAEDTGQRSAVIYTLIENVRRHGKDPRAYLQWVFERLPSMTNQDDLLQLLPAAWLKLQKSVAKSA